MPKSHPVRCAGIIVFSGTQTILTKKRNSRSLSFPKGKLESNESVIEGAWRELLEETGLTPQEVELIPRVHVDEVTKSGRPWIRYFIGRLKSDSTCPKLTFDPKELSRVKWYGIRVALRRRKLKDKRKRLLEAAYAIHREKNGETS